MAPKEIRRMTDSISKERRSANMRAIKSRDTQPEKIVRTVVHRMGYRFRLYRADLPGKPDLIFPGRHAAVFVHGCFWHGHMCKEGIRKPKTNVDYWTAKLARNTARDMEHLMRLKAQGWRSLIVWECETKRLERLASRLRRFLG